MKSQGSSILISLWLFAVLLWLYWFQIWWLNYIWEYFNITTSNIQLFERWYGLITDILIGLTIYLKTSIDFALLIWVLMEKYPWMKNQLMIQSGTTIWNALWTMIVLLIWFFFKEVYRLLALMIFFASLVLFELAQTSIEHIVDDNPDTTIDDEPVPPWTAKRFALKLHDILAAINHYLEPITKKVLPSLSFSDSKALTTRWVFATSFTIPFILGMDDFAWYVPLFSIINVFWFWIGVFLWHTILTTFLFISPKRTVHVIKNPVIAILGSLAFIWIAIWWLYDSFKIIWEHYILPNI